MRNARFPGLRRFGALCGSLTSFALVGCGTSNSGSSDANGGAPATNAGASGMSDMHGEGGTSGSASGGAGGSAGSTAAAGESAGGESTGGAGAGGTSGSAGTGGVSAGAGGTSGAATGGSGGNGGSGGAACVTAGTELCDDFESGQIDTKKWQLQPLQPAGETAVVDGVHTHGGKYAFHAHGTAGAINKAILSEVVTFPAKNNSFYARIFAYFTPGLPVMDGGSFHTGFIWGSGKNDLGAVDAGMGLNGGSGQFAGYSIFYGAPSFEFGPYSNTKVPANDWVCIELFEGGSSADTEIRKVWVKDTELTDLESDSAKAAGTTHPNHKTPTFDHVNVGLGEFHNSPTLTDMWMDDVRISSQKIGCKN